MTGIPFLPPSGGNYGLTWSDKMSSSLLQANLGYRFDTDILNGYPVFNSFSFNRYYLNNSDITAAVNADFTLFCVIAINTTSVFCNIMSANLNLRGFRLCIDGNNILSYREYNASGTTLFNCTSPLFYIPNNAYKLCCVNITRGGNIYVRTEINNRIRFSTNAPAYVIPVPRLLY